ncbi:unknown [Clostridium sp. CAG:273]|nr:unknown [Clostridium sp. CAG:273]
MANKIAKEHNIIVMDTLRKKETLEVINKLAGNNNIMLLYIDAKFEYRVNRE